MLWINSKQTTDVNAGPDRHRRISETSPLPEMLGWSTGPEEMRTGGRRLDFELWEDNEHTLGLHGPHDISLDAYNVKMWDTHQ